MQPARPPSNERARLDRLRGLRLLDTAADERFDRYTRIAKRLFGVPIVALTLIDEHRQWFKSRIGLAASETSRDAAFCAHTILGSDVLVVDDARLDARFDDNPLVTGDPSIRFYAGASVCTDDGFAMGALCLIDRAPRTLTSEDAALLRDLADMLEHELAAMELAITDELTGLSNRRGFRMIAERTVPLLRRVGEPATLMMFDLDGFKAINDTFGHAAGDRALVDFADALTSAFRESDAVARLGGDEFAVLGVGDATAAEVPLSRLRATLSAMRDRPYRVEFSVGVVLLPSQSTQSLDALIDEADHEMYAQKGERRRRR